MRNESEGAFGALRWEACHRALHHRPIRRKSTTILSLLRLISPPGYIEGGEVLLNGVDLLKLSEEAIRKTRFAQISLIPQGAMNSLNPVMRIKNHIIDTIQAHDKRLPKDELKERAEELLESVGLEAEVGEMYPHELSGGMKQRVCIAMAISLQPRVIIADEPTSALDVVVQKQVMDTLGRVQESMGSSVILVGHDMGLMAQFVDKVGIMYAGKLVEIGPVEDIFADPLHPYTQLLIASLPSLEIKALSKGIPGVTPSLLDPPSGCAFHPRCPQRAGICSEMIFPLVEVRPGRQVACRLYPGGQL
jgi:peptide/nickel transport system ATP-binding protein